MTLFAAMLGALIACIVFHQQTALGAHTWAITLTLPSLSVCLWLYAHYQIALNHRSQDLRHLRLFLVFSVFASISWAQTHWRASERLASAMPAACEGVELPATVDVLTFAVPLPTRDAETGSGARNTVRVSIPSKSDYHERSAAGHAIASSLASEKILAIPSVCEGKQLTLWWYWSELPKAVSHDHPTRPRVGERWQGTVKLKRPIWPLQMHGFDPALHAFSQDVQGTGSFVGSPRNVMHSENKDMTNTSVIFLLIEYWREAIHDQLHHAMLEKRITAEAHAVLQALIIGEQRYLSPAQWELFANTGIQHLIAISGMHVTLFATLTALLARRLWRCSSKLCRWLPAPKAAAMIGLVIAAIYCGIAGWGIPAQRTLWMLLAIALAVMIQAQPNAWQLLAFAGLLLILLDPWAVLNLGCWLSFTAVSLLLWLQHQRHDLRPQAAWMLTLRQSIRLQWGIVLGMLPLSLTLFAQQSLISPLSNALAIPWVSYIITPLALIGGIGMQDWALALASGCYEYLSITLVEMLRLWQTLLPSIVVLSPPPLLVGILASLACLWFLTPRGTPGRGLALLLASSVIWWSTPRPAENTWWLDVLDIGQGNSILIRTAKHSLLYDAGPASTPRADSGYRVILPALRQAGIRQLDGMVISHADNDHSGGAASVIQHAQPRWLLSSFANTDAAKQLTNPWIPAFAGMTKPGSDQSALSHSSPSSRHSRESGNLTTTVIPAPTTVIPAPTTVIPAKAGIQEHLPHIMPHTIPHHRCVAGQHWQWDGVSFTVLHPVANDYANFSEKTTNANSCVLKISSPYGSALLTGDIGMLQEQAMLDRLSAEQLRADILLIPHHGSKTSSSAAWIRAVAPKIAIAQLGYRNRYGHPHSDVWQRYQHILGPQSELLRTDETGAIHIKTKESNTSVTESQYTITQAKTARRRYWHHASK